MIAQELKQYLRIVHDESPILIKVGDTLIEVKELRRIADYDGKVSHAFVAVDFVTVTK